MPNYIDETGNKYGHWSVIRKVDNPQKNGALFLCRCDCGKEQLILGKRLRNGETSQCADCAHKAHIKQYAGAKFGMLTVLPEYESRKGKIYWHCKCDCGNDTWVSNGNLTSGEVKSCGCLSHRCNRALEDLTGQTFDDLTVLELAGTQNGQRIWKCQCICGNITFLSTGALHAGKTKSCGCRRYIDIAPGSRYGKLTVIEPTAKRSSNGCIIYKCKCDCGNIHEVISSRLKDGTIKSCGCGRNLSYNEEHIAQLLTAAHIPFTREKTYSDLHNPMTTRGRPLEYDFFVDNRYIIEFDGAQHFITKNSSWDTQEHLDMTHFRDMIKNEYCFNHNIPLIRIPYDFEYTMEDLILESTRCLLTPEKLNDYYACGNYNEINNL